MHSIVFDVRLLRQLSVVLEKTIGKIKANQLTSNIDTLVKKYITTVKSSGRTCTYYVFYVI
jgi:hypothetical protein